MHVTLNDIEVNQLQVSALKDPPLGVEDPGFSGLYGWTAPTQTQCFSLRLYYHMNFICDGERYCNKRKRQTGWKKSE